MTVSLFRALPLAVLACVLSGAALPAGAAKYKTSVPPSAELIYSIKAKQKGIPLEGDAIMRWTAADGKFVASNEARAMLFGKILDVKSEGTIDAYGLAPNTFTEKRFRRAPTTTSFDRESRTIRFTASDRSYPISGGEQDRNSTIWQLISVARASSGKFRPGSSWSFFVAGQRDADEWIFKVVKQEKIRIPLGEMNTVHVMRLPPPDSREQKLDIWLAPSLEWYPARVRFSDDNGDYIEQTLQRVNKKAS